MPTTSNNAFIGPYKPKSPMKAYVFSSKLIQDGIMITIAKVVYALFLLKNKQLGMQISNVKNVIRNAYQNELIVSFK